MIWSRGKTRAESLIHPIQRASYQHTKKTQTNSNYDNQIEQNTTGLFILNTTGVRVMLHEQSWQDVTFELALGLDLSWLWSSSDSGWGLGFLSSDSRRWASDGKRERNDLSSMSSSVIESSNFTEYSVAMEALSADWRNRQEVVKTAYISQDRLFKLLVPKKCELYLSLQAGCTRCPSKGSHRQRCEPGPPLNYCSCLFLVSSSPFDQNQVDSAGNYCCRHHLKTERLAFTHCTF